MIFVFTRLFFISKQRVSFYTDGTSPLAFWTMNGRTAELALYLPGK